MAIREDVMQMEATRPAANVTATTRPEFATILGRVRALRSEIEARSDVRIGGRGAKGSRDAV